MRAAPSYPSRVGQYRKYGETLRLLAGQTRFTESRIQLLALAQSFEKLASHVETREAKDDAAAAD